MHVCMYVLWRAACHPQFQLSSKQCAWLVVSNVWIWEGWALPRGVVGVATFYGGVVALGEGMRGIPVATTPLHRVGDNPFGLSIAWLFVTAPLKALSTAEPALEFATTNNIQSGVTISIKQWDLLGLQLTIGLRPPWVTRFNP